MIKRLVEEADDLAGDVLSPGLLVVHDTGRGGEDDVTELTRWEELDDPLLHITELYVVAWGDDTGLVEARTMLVRVRAASLENIFLPAVELDDDLAVAVVVNLLELANVTWACFVSACRKNLKVPLQPKVPRTCKILANVSQSPEHLKGVGRGAFETIA